MPRHDCYSKLCGFYLCLFCAAYAYAAPTRCCGQPVSLRHARKLRDNGPPAPIRTGDLPLRRRLLYPAELQAGRETDSTIYCGGAHQPRRTTAPHSITPRERAPAALVTPYWPHFLSGPSNAILSTVANAGKTRAWPETQSLKSHLT